MKSSKRDDAGWAHKMKLVIFLAKLGINDDKVWHSMYTSTAVQT